MSNRGNWRCILFINLYYRLDLAYKIGIFMLAAEVSPRAMTL